MSWKSAVFIFYKVFFGGKIVQETQSCENFLEFFWVAHKLIFGNLFHSAQD
jgi:hypothetical protein